MTERPLPERPWLRRDTPILWRSAHTVQVGEDRRTVLLADVPRELLLWVRSLSGDRTLDQCLGACPDPDTGRILLHALTVAGALDDAARVPQSTAHLTRALRDRSHRLAAAARHTYPDERAHLSIDARHHARIGIHGHGPLADALRISLRQSGIGHVLMTAPPSSAARLGRSHAQDIDLFVLAHSWHPDIFDDAGCLALDVPHLPVSVWGAHGVVGPLVVPGRSPCVRCGYLHAHDRDRSFATLHLQRSHATPDVLALDPALVHGVAAHATMQVCAWVEALGGDIDTPHRLHLRLPGGVMTREDFPAHPLCGCAWQALRSSA